VVNVAVTPWQYGNVPGPKTALTLKGDVAGRLIKAAKKPLIIVGAEALKVKLDENRTLLDYAIELSKLSGAPVVATANTLKAFLERGYKPAAAMGSIEITERLRDRGWSIDGSGAHDLVIYIGITYQLQSQLLSSLKNFALHLRTMSLDRYYHPNATWSFPNLSFDKWVDNLNMIIEVLRGGVGGR